MSMELQVTVDPEMPHELTKWWADALGWEVEPSDEEFIRGLISAGHAQVSDTTTFEGVLVWQQGAAIRDPDHPQRPRVVFQWVPESKQTKNRLHLDLQAGDGREDLAAVLESKGATIMHRRSQGPYRWITMSDPEGNEFCLC
ncbi:VOC family protein [Rhodococcus sp. NPDC058521]|uniref:VOC family protein n=1 Tax=Rhodococcus sp. NPDC058521 TaxID=3346536 RepID=UPI003656F310